MKLNKKFVLLFLNLFLLFLVISCFHSKQPPKEIVKVTRGKIQATVSASGKVVSSASQVVVSSRIPGIVERVLVREFQSVHKGDLMAVFDNSEYLAQYNSLLQQKESLEVKLSQSILALEEEKKKTDIGLEKARVALKASRDKLNSTINQGKSRLLELELKVNEASSELEVARQRYKNLKLQTAIQIKQSEELVKEAELNLEVAKRELERQKPLWDKGYIAKKDWESIENAFFLAKSKLDLSNEQFKNTQLEADSALKEAELKVEQLEKAHKNARENFSLAKEDYELQVEIANANLASAQAEFSLAKQAKDALEIKGKDIEALNTQIAELDEQIKIAKEKLDSCNLIAKANGTIINFNLEPGQGVTPGVPLFAIADLSEQEIEAMVDEVDIAQVTPGQRVRITADAFPGKEFWGRVSKVSPLAEVVQNVTVYKIIITLKPPFYLKPGMNTYNDIIISEKINALLVPVEALSYEDGKVFVFTRENSSWIKKPVTLGITTNEQAEILSGVKEGEELLIQQMQ